MILIFNEKNRDRDEMQKDVEKLVKELTKKEKEQLRTFASEVFNTLGWPQD